MHVLILSTIKF